MRTQERKQGDRRVVRRSQGHTARKERRRLGAVGEDVHRGFRSTTDTSRCQITAKNLEIRFQKHADIQRSTQDTISVNAVSTA